MAERPHVYLFSAPACHYSGEGMCKGHKNAGAGGVQSSVLSVCLRGQLLCDGVSLPVTGYGKKETENSKNGEYT